MSYVEKALRTSIGKKPNSSSSPLYKAVELNDVLIMNSKDKISENPRMSGNKFRCDSNECDLERKVCGELN